MSTNKFQYWPSNGQLGSTKFTMPTNAEDWPSGDALVGNFVFSEGKLVDFIDIKGLTPNTSKSTTIPYDYVNIELPFAEDAMTINRGPRNKYLIIKFNDKEVEEGGNVIVTHKYKNCKTVDDVKAVDPDYKTTDIVDGIWSEGLGDLEDGAEMFAECENLTSFSSDLSSLTNGNKMFDSCFSLTSFSSDLPNLTNGSNMFSSCTNLTSFSSDLPSLNNGSGMFSSCTNLTSFTSSLNYLITGSSMFNRCKLNSESIMYIVETINDITAEKQLYIDGTIPYVTLSNGVSSATRGFMSNGNYILTYNNPKLYTSYIPDSYVGKLTLGINVTNNSSTIKQQLEDFAKEATFDSWAELKQAFVDKGWTVTAQYNGRPTTTYSLRRPSEDTLPVFVKLEEVEETEKYADYTSIDDSKKYRLNWFHETTGSTEGYIQFNSLEEAAAHFNIQPIERN